jgi:prepilin-type N-terminal cleavage/methylation domain-containing protein
MKPNRLSQRPTTAFTLIELLVVISIIALLAALILWGTSLAGEKKVRSRVTAELQGLQLAIDGFHKQFGFYPASNPDVTLTDMHPLFYELTSTVRDKSGNNFTDIFGSSLASAEIKTKFGVDGFINSKDGNSTDKSQAQNFMSGLRPDAYGADPANSKFKMLVVPYKGPRGAFNPWHYNSTSPTNNPESYDLWAEVVVAGKTNLIANWKE